MDTNDGKLFQTLDRPTAIIIGIVVALLVVGLGGGMMGPGMMLTGPLLIIAAALLVAWLLRSGWSAGTGTAGDGASGDRAQDILRERYARGELTREQYEQMRRDLAVVGEVPASPPAD